MFEGAPKRKHILKRLSRYIPKQFAAYYLDKTSGETTAEPVESAPTFSMKDAMQNALARRQNKERTLHRENKENLSGHSNGTRDQAQTGRPRPKQMGRRTKVDPNTFVGAPRVMTSATVREADHGLNAPHRSGRVPISASSGGIQRKPRYSKRARMLNPSSVSVSSASSPQITLQAPPKQMARRTKSAADHSGFDDSFKKLRRLQDADADLSRPVDRHKRKQKAITRKGGFDAVAKGLMAPDLYSRYDGRMKEWKGLDRNDINFASNKKRVLQSILNIFVECSIADIEAGHLSKFRNLSSGFDKRLTNRGDRKVYHEIILQCTALSPYLKKLRAQRKEQYPL